MTTKPCKHGHTEGRFPSGDCRACTRARVKAWRDANRERYAEQTARASVRRRERQEAARKSATRIGRLIAYVRACLRGAR